MGKDKIILDICPFCGSDAELVEVDVDCIVVRCKECNASGDYYASESVARSVWNDRRGYYKKRLLSGIAGGLSSILVIFIIGMLLGAISHFIS